VAVTYISWAPHCSRSDFTARELRGVSHMVYWAGLGSRPATIGLKYLGQALRTWQILLREKPDAVFVMSPPVIAGLVVIPYCAIRNIPFVVDAHTGAFLNPRWRHFTGLQYWLCRRAATTIVTNTHLEAMLTAQGADVTVLPDVPVKYPDNGSPFAKTGFSVAVICSLDRDEPVDVIFDSMRTLPDINFFMTGDRRKIERLYPDLPPNLFLTGFLDNAAYGQLLRGADAVMALTTGSHTMLRAAYEAIYQDTPIIISESPTLREEFPMGGILVDNSVETITAAVREIQGNQERYRREARELRAYKENRWRQKKELLIRKISNRRRQRRAT
jgi:glycosyltransferase involved in cell wall biosynthesis